MVEFIASTGGEYGAHAVLCCLDGDGGTDAGRGACDDDDAVGEVVFHNGLVYQIRGVLAVSVWLSFFVIRVVENGQWKGELV